MKSTRTPILRSQVLSPLTSGILSLRLSHSLVIQRCGMRLSGSSIVCPPSSPLRKEVIPVKSMYEKPALYIERFMLTQSIASGCSPSNPDFGMPNQHSKEVCGWDIYGIVLFMDDSICDFLTEDLGGVCYNAPSGGMTAFATS